MLLLSVAPKAPRLTCRPWRSIAPSVLTVAALSGPAQAEDIDLYAAGGAAGTGNVNVLFVLDNTSNWSAAGWSKAGALERCGGNEACRTETEAIFGSASSLVQGQVQVRTLKRALQNGACSTDAAKKLNVNVGIMLLSANKGSVTDEPSWVGAWPLQAVAPATAEHCTSLLSKLDAIDANINSADYKAAGNAHYGGAMFEAFKYFGGHTNPAGARTGSAGSPVQPYGFGPQRYTKAQLREDPNAFTDSTRQTYRSPSTGCNDRNYLVLVGNGWPDQEPTTSGREPYDRTLVRLDYNIGQVTPTASNKIRYADEWAKFMATTDVSSAAGVQNVVTFTVNVHNGSADPDQTALLKSMAAVGGAGEAGGYFEAGLDVLALGRAFSSVFASVAAVDSVFAAPSLPVSVSTEGTYRNQIFFGMFRPDAAARPRWAGNLKQYQFGTTTSGELFLSDRDGRPALNAANTGFIDACRSSFWTRDTSPYWENVPLALRPPANCRSAPASAALSDQPDGDAIEKGGAAQQLRALLPAARVLRTCLSLNCSSVGEFNASNVKTLAGNLGLTSLLNDSTLLDSLTGWIRGENTGDGPKNSLGLWETYGQIKPDQARPTIHGDVVHSRPLPVPYGDNGEDVVVYYGAGDGWLRATDGNLSGAGAGQEIWGFFAPEFLPRMQRLRDNTQLIAFPGVTSSDSAPKDYFFDGNIGAYMERGSSGLSKLYLYPTMRRGGRMIYAFDASKRPVASDASSLPVLKWKFGCPSLNNDEGCTSGASRIGQTWSTPRAFRVKGHNTAYLVFGGGYDNCEDTDTCGATTKGQGLFILNAETGALVRFIDLASLTEPAGRVIADVLPVDVNRDGNADVLYSADTRGNLCRVTLSDRDANYSGWPALEWSSKTYCIAKVADWSSTSWLQRRKFQYAPDVVVYGDSVRLLIGTGDREQPLAGANATKVRNRFYAIKDDIRVGGRSGSNSTPVLIDDSKDCDPGGDAVRASGCALINVTGLDLDYSAALSDPATRGWVMDLSSKAEPFEQVVTTPVTMGGYVYFSTYQAKASENACSFNLGTSRGYAVSFLDGSRRQGDTSREAIFRGGGFAPSPVAGIVEIAGRKQTFLIGGRDSASYLEASPLSVQVGTRRRKLYRFQKIDF